MACKCLPVISQSSLLWELKFSQLCSKPLPCFCEMHKYIMSHVHLTSFFMPTSLHTVLCENRCNCTACNTKVEHKRKLSNTSSLKQHWWAIKTAAQTNYWDTVCYILSKLCVVQIWRSNFLMIKSQNFELYSVRAKTSLPVWDTNV